MWAHKARSNWIVHRDRNTKYFQNCGETEKGPRIELFKLRM